MLTSAFGANMQNEGSKKFMKIQDEENVQKRHAIVVRTLKSEEEYIKSIKYIQEVCFFMVRSPFIRNLLRLAECEYDGDNSTCSVN